MTKKTGKGQWKYKITSGAVGMILLSIMLAGITALCIWLHKTQNDGIILARIILIIFAAAFVLGLYRALFFKVLIGRDGFYHQSAPGNGRYYPYSEIRNAWVSSGRETNASTAIYCNYETRDGKLVRIAITQGDMDAANYLVKKAAAANSTAETAEDQREYTISGKTQGRTRIAVICGIFAIVMWLSYSLWQEGLPPVSCALPTIAAFCALVYLVIHYFFYKIEIRLDGFYCRTNPFNEQYYNYRDLAGCKLIEKRKQYGSAYRSGGRRTHYLHYLVFTDKAGKEHRIAYDKGLFEKEIEILVSRINQSQS